MEWYTFEIEFKVNGSTYEETVVKQGRSYDDALGKAWARVLLEYDGAIYISAARVPTTFAF